MFGMQRPLAQANWEVPQVTLPHSCSSELSPQSFSWSQRKFWGMHLPDRHWNSLDPQVGSVDGKGWVIEMKVLPKTPLD